MSINKFYHLIHYSDILWADSLQCYFCIRFEVKYAEIKLRTQNVYNFKNLLKTLVRVCQCVQSSKWRVSDVKLERVQILGGKILHMQETQRKFLIKIRL